MPKWILGVLIFLVLLFASVFVLALLLLWLMLRRREEVAPDLESEYIDEDVYWEEAPVLLTGAEGFADADESATEGETEAVDIQDVAALAAAVAAANEAAEAAAGVEEEAEGEEAAGEVEAPDIAPEAIEAVTGPKAVEPEEETEAGERELDSDQVEGAGPPVAMTVEPQEPDDLKLVEGIGPKIAAVLQAAGITTFSQLASTDVGTIEGILEDESPRLLRLAKPETWPEQAEVAATGDWDALKELQDSLRAGRRRQ